MNHSESVTIALFSQAKMKKNMQFFLDLLMCFFSQRKLSRFFYFGILQRIFCNLLIFSAVENLPNKKAKGISPFLFKQIHVHIHVHDHRAKMGQMGQVFQNLY